MIFPLITDYEMRLPYYVAGIGCFHNQEPVLRPHGYPYYQWIQCRQGKGELVVAGATHPVGENQGMLLFPDEPHEYYAVSDVWEVDWIIFGGLHVDDFVKRTAGIKKSGVYYVSQPDILYAKLQETLTIELSDHPMKSLECSRMAYDILVEILGSTSLKSDNSMNHQYRRLKPLFDHIEKNCHRSLSLQDLSAIAGVTPQHLCTLFKKATHLRIFEYIHFVRIKKSKEYLLGSRDMQIKEIARLTGYEDVSYFCAQFKKLEQMSPTDFRKLHA